MLSGRRVAGRAAGVLALAVLAACGGSGTGKSVPPPAASPAPPSSRVPSSPAPPPAGHASGPAISQADWPAYHRSADRHGMSPTMPRATGPLTVTHSVKLDGAVYASPLVVGDLTIVATENDTVYAFDQSYRQVWKRSLGSPSPARQRQCGNIDPLGITGTPVYDAGTGEIYVVAEHGGEHGGGVRHDLYALTLQTGAVAWSKNVDLPGVSARDMQQRGALAITGGRVWVSYGGQFGDCGDYKGRVVGVPLTGNGGVVSYTPPTRQRGGMWNPNGPTITSGGDLLVVSANGAAFPGDPYDHTNSVLQLTPDAKLVDSFAPTDWAENNQGDVGLGSQGVALIGDKWAVIGGKSGPVYVLRQGHLGGIGGQVSVQHICVSFGGAAVDGDVVYLPCVDGVRAVRVDGSGQLHVLWHAASSISGSPVIGGGRIWTLDTSAGVLHALDPATGDSAGQVSVGVANRFATPAISGREVIVPTLSGIAVVRTS